MTEYTFDVTYALINSYDKRRFKVKADDVKEAFRLLLEMIPDGAIRRIDLFDIY